MFLRTLPDALVRARDALARLLIRLRVAPNALTLLGLLVTVAASALIAHGHLILAALTLIAAGAFDVLDGAVARLAGRVTPFGGVLDSTLDRYSDFAVFVGCAWLVRDDLTMVAVTFLALRGALLTSYVRARAEHVIDRCTAGFFERGERCVFILVALVFGNIPIMLWTLAVFANLAVLQRLAHTALALREKEKGAAPGNRPFTVRLLLWDFPRRHPLCLTADILFAALAAVPSSLLQG